MKVLRILGRLVTQDRKRFALLLETGWHLVQARRLVLGSDFIDYKTTLGTPKAGEDITVKLADNWILHDIRWAILALNRTAGGRFTCLMQVIAVQRMLVRRDIPYAIVFGAKLGTTPDPRTEGDAMSAHAWICAGGGIVVGEKERAAFAPVVSYIG